MGFVSVSVGRAGLGMEMCGLPSVRVNYEFHDGDSGGFNRM